MTYADGFRDAFKGLDPQKVARLFHEAYERLAPEYGYKTREASAKPWSEVPDNNRALMTATCREVLLALTPPPAEAAAVCGAVSKNARGVPDGVVCEKEPHTDRFHQGAHGAMWDRVPAEPAPLTCEHGRTGGMCPHCMGINAPQVSVRPATLVNDLWQNDVNQLRELRAKLAEKEGERIAAQDCAESNGRALVDAEAKLAEVTAERDEAIVDRENFFDEASKKVVALREHCDRCQQDFDALKAKFAEALKDCENLRGSLHAALVSKAEWIAKVAAGEAREAVLRKLVLRLLDGLEGGHTNALYGPARDALRGTP